MRYLFLVNTPAHAHLYRHVVDRLDAEGHRTLVLARDYGCTLPLLDAFGVDYRVYGRCGTTKVSLARNLPWQGLGIARHAPSFDPDLIFGMGAYAALAGVLTRTRPVLVLDSEPTSLDHAVSCRVARAVLTPGAFRKDLGTDHYTFEGFTETAYLHPEVFSPSPVRSDLGLDPDDRFAIVRLNAFGSHHDVAAGGFTADARRRLVERLSEHATVLVSDEGGDLSTADLPARHFDLHPSRMHDALAAADLLVADTQTMVTEAALLGTPAVRSNSFVGEDDMGNFLELESAGLVRNCRSADYAIELATELLSDPSTAETWRRRRAAYVGDMVDLTRVLVDVAKSPDAPGSVDGVNPRGERATVDEPPRLSLDR
jgi:predicted glycosyltransferase